MTKLDQHYVDPRLVALYDIENPGGADSDFYIRLAAELAARRIIDLGVTPPDLDGWSYGEVTHALIPSST